MAALTGLRMLDEQTPCREPAKVTRPVAGRTAGQLAAGSERTAWAGRECPEQSWCDGCGRPLRPGWWVRPSCGQRETPWMCPACFWAAWPR